MIVRPFDEEECSIVVINSRLNAEQQRAIYEHELQHVKAKGFDQMEWTADQIEMLKHYAI